MLLFTWMFLVTPIQIEQIYDVYLAAFTPQNRFKDHELEDYFAEKVMPRLKKPLLLAVAIDQNRIIAYAIFEKFAMNYYLAEMAVQPEYQGKGIGKKLVFSILEKDPAAKKIVLLTEIENRWSRPFYEKIGFKPSTFYLPDYSPEIFTAYEFSIYPSLRK